MLMELLKLALSNPKTTTNILSYGEELYKNTKSSPAERLAQEEREERERVAKWKKIHAKEDLWIERLLPYIYRCCNQSGVNRNTRIYKAKVDYYKLQAMLKKDNIVDISIIRMRGTLPFLPLSDLANVIAIKIVEG